MFHKENEFESDLKVLTRMMKVLRRMMKKKNELQICKKNQ